MRLLREICLPARIAVNAAKGISGGKPLVAQTENGYCIFWDQLCTIHPVKPHMCRNWPFIESILVDVENWQSMAASCPGMRTDFSDNQIRKCVHDVIKIRNECEMETIY
jgi:Fe-S-cluster containining protein